ncbi:hypothetical protein BDV25DRAFT_107119 [Aspergillus avenaceus]|uniref:RING-type domain-containing protein n=1 Tax=Aspergillus avenaceus TaxID=36643 RepID=A0A5N6TWI5_ASPAV|nr:hypothetical protein BDV25DRAFT_107119 [Aspergillus avenaceus]
MFTWFPPATSSNCIHKHALGCLHLSSICCACLLQCSNPLGTPRSTASTSVPYCWKCEEYWDTHGSPSSVPLSLTHLPFSADLSVANVSGFNRNLFSNPSRSSLPTSSPHRRSAQSGSIETLREELQAINHGTATILNNLQLITEALLMSQPAVPPSWGSNTIPELTRVDYDPARMGMSNPGNMVSPQLLSPQHVSSVGTPSEQNAASTPQIPHGLPNATGSLGVLDGQGLGTPTANSEFVPRAQTQQYSLFPSQLVNSNETFQNTPNQYGPSVSIGNSDQNQYAGPYGQWRNTTQTTRPSTSGQAVTSNADMSSYYPPIYPAQVNQINPYLPYQLVTPLPQPPVTQPGTPATSRMENTAVPAMARQGSFRASPYGQFPQTGVSPTSIHQRRQSRTQSFASQGVPANQRPHTRTSSQTALARGRYAVNTSSPAVSNISSSAPQRGQPAVAAPPVLPPSVNEAYYPPHLSQQQRLELAQQIRMRELLRSVRSNDPAHDFSYYARPHRPTTPPARGLDDQRDGRPAPKEDDELTVNLECKICFSQLVDTVLIPCGHAILCRWCADQHTRPDRMRPKALPLCPLCRDPVKQKLRIYLS